MYRNFLYFLRFLFHGIKNNRIFEKAASLSYVTLIAFVPLVAAFVSVYDIFFPNYQNQLELLLREFLPYENTEWLSYIEQFLDQAQGLGGISLILFFLIALRVVMVIESNINQVWGVDRRRSLGSRISSFTLLLFWGPVLLGLVGSLFFFLQQQGMPHFLLYLGPKLMTFLIFTMLFWTVPYVRVRLDSAFFGGICVTLLLAVGKGGFLAYLRGVKIYSGVLGSLGLVLLFFITINLMWAFILIGALVAYTHQNFSALKKEHEERDIPEERHRLFWSLAILIHVIRRYSSGEDPLTVTQLSEVLEVPLARLQGAVDKIVMAGLMVETGKEGKLLFPHSPEQITIGEVFRLLFRDSLEIPGPEMSDLGPMLTPHISSFAEALKDGAWSTPLISLIEEEGYLVQT